MRESDELDVDPITKGLANPDDRFEIVEADIIVDIDVATRACGAIHDQRADERRGARFDRQGDPMALDAFERDALANAAPFEVGQARRAEMGLVEMDVALDKSRQEEQPLKVDAFVGRRRGPRRVHSDDKAGRDFHVGETPLGQARVGQDHQTRFSRFAAAYW